MTNEETITYLEWMKDLAEDLETPEQKDTMLETINKSIEALNLIPDGATNGDVIKALFPNDCVKQENGDKIVFSFIKAAGVIILDADWWNAPYRTESEVAG